MLLQEKIDVKHPLRLHLLQEEAFTSGATFVLFLIENQYRATVQLLRNPAFLIVGGGGGPPPINQMLGLIKKGNL